MNMPGIFELIIIFLIILLFIGGKKLPEFAKAVGEAIREFKKAIKGNSDDKSQ